MFNASQLDKMTALLSKLNATPDGYAMFNEVFTPVMEWIHQEMLDDLEEQGVPLDSDAAVHVMQQHQLLWAKGFFMGVAMQAVHPCAELDTNRLIAETLEDIP